MKPTTWTAAFGQWMVRTGAGRRGLAAAAAITAGAALLGGAAVQADTPAADGRVAREYRAQVALDVGTDGRISVIELPPEIPAVLAGPARDAIGHWQFKPPMRGGHAVTARTYVRVALQVVQQAGGTYGLRAVYRSNGPGLGFPKRPEYPREELRQRGQGSLVMEAIVQPDGALTDIHVASHRINHPNPGAFIKSAEAVMRAAVAQPERVDGQAVATRVQVPFVYALQRISRSEALSRPSENQGPPASGGFDPIGEPVALDSPVQRIAQPPG